MAFDHAFVNLTLPDVVWKDSTGERVPMGHRGDAELTQVVLMSASEAGWELVAVEGGALFFKRPKVAAPAGA